MTTDIKTLTTSEAAARVGLSHQYLRFLLGQGKGPKGTREGKGGRGGGYRFLPCDLDAWDATRTKRAPKGSKKGYTHAELTEIAPDGLVTEAGGAAFKALVNAVCGAPDLAGLLENPDDE